MINTRQIFEKQNATNVLFVGAGWISDPKVRNEQAILDEANELRVSMGWAPWWKGTATPDAENVKMEIIDILHFHVAGMLKETFADIQAETEDEDLISIPQVMEEVINTSNEIFLDCMCCPQNPAFVGDELDMVNYYLGDLLTHGFHASTTALIALAAYVGMSVQDMVDLYVIKNVLNKFRKDNNYKGDQEGQPEYRKVINGQEDNVYIVQLAKELGASLTFDGLYERYAQFYQQSAATA